MYYEHHPTAAMLPALLKALEREDSEFVRPALVRALAAQGSDPRVRETLLVEVVRGQDFFRSGVIEALGDYRAAYAVEPLMAIARLAGPLQTDAVIALGKLKDQRAMETLAALQRSAPRESQPTIAAAICLLGINCDAHRGVFGRNAADSPTRAWAIRSCCATPLLRSSRSRILATCRR